MPAPPLNGPFTMPMYNSYVPRPMRPWTYLLFAFFFQLSSGCLNSGTLLHVMGDTCLMKEDVMMVVLCGVVGVNMPFPFLFRFKFRFTNRQLLVNAATVIAVCNFLSMHTESVPLLCILSYIAGFFKLCGTFECMSNIQLWMTPKRDFSIFFPLLYCIVLGDMSLSPWIAVKLTYAFQSWHAVQWFLIALMALVIVCVLTLTHGFCPMERRVPLISVDWLGCLLWSMVMVELIFLFNYGEYFNWWDGQPFRVVACAFPVTLAVAIGRMRHIRHPYIAPSAWQYKKFLPLLGLFALLELVNSTSKSLQNVLTGSILHFGTLATSSLYLVEWAGTISGCLFVMFWVKSLRRSYTKLLTLGVLVLLMYEMAMYFLVSPGVDICKLFAPAFCRSFGVAIFFTALTIYMEKFMPFQHFFMGLTMAGLIRNGVVETICSGLYGFHLRRLMADNLARGLGYMQDQVMMLSLKRLFGATCIVAVAVLAVFLIWDLPPVRTTVKNRVSTMFWPR